MLGQRNYSWMGITPLKNVVTIFSTLEDSVLFRYDVLLALISSSPIWNYDYVNLSQNGASYCWVAIYVYTLYIFSWIENCNQNTHHIYLHGWKIATKRYVVEWRKKRSELHFECNNCVMLMINEYLPLSIFPFFISLCRIDLKSRWMYTIPMVYEVM